MRFADTNILLYAISKNPDEQAKAALANELLSARDIGLSVQVLQEFYVQATRQTRPDRLTQSRPPRSSTHSGVFKCRRQQLA